MSIILLVRHRENMKRLIAGTEFKLAGRHEETCCFSVFLHSIITVSALADEFIEFQLNSGSKTRKYPLIFCFRRHELTSAGSHPVKQGICILA